MESKYEFRDFMVATIKYFMDAGSKFYDTNSVHEITDPVIVADMVTFDENSVGHIRQRQSIDR